MFKKLILKDLLKRIGSGIADGLPLVGQIKANVESKVHDGLDWIKLLSALAPTIMLIAFLFGKITMEDLEKLVKLFF
jgi:hypothetical protein